MAVRLTDIIAPSFYEVHRDVCAGQHTHYVLKGGRGSTKSSYISLEIVCGIIKNPDAHAIVFRKIADTLRDSVFAQMLWAIEKLGVSQYFKATVSPMKITYLPSGQTIMFRGLDDPMKVKSIKSRSAIFVISGSRNGISFPGCGKPIMCCSRLCAAAVNSMFLFVQSP